MSDSTKISTGKPKVGGGIYVAPVGTTLPTDASTAIDPAFKTLGSVSEDGLTNADSKTFEDVKDWSGDVVDSLLTEHKDTFKFKLLEYMNEDVLKFVYGQSNVSGTITDGITIKSNASETSAVAIVIEMLLKGDVKNRIVVPHAKVSEIAEIVYKASEPVAFETTVLASPDATGQTHYNYMKK